MPLHAPEGQGSLPMPSGRSDELESVSMGRCKKRKSFVAKE